jgi:hypothetical protein
MMEKKQEGERRRRRSLRLAQALGSQLSYSPTEG